MQKAEVEKILIIVKSGEQEALNMKIYKDGTLCRRGCGGLPELGISMMCHTGSSSVFDELMAAGVTQQILDSGGGYEDNEIKTPLEYILAFYGVTKNGETGEGAEWTKSTGINFLLDSQRSTGHPLLTFIDRLAMDACEATNSWYFDAIMKVVFKMNSPTLPPTLIATPNTLQGIQASFKNYVNQIKYSVRKWDVRSFAKNKIYTSSEGAKMTLEITVDGEEFNFGFVPAKNATIDGTHQINLMDMIKENDEILKRSSAISKEDEYEKAPAKKKW
jgi:hypothetical protein